MPSYRGSFALASWHRQQLLQNLVTCKREPKLGRRSQYSSWSALEESSEAFLFVHSTRAVSEGGVLGVAFPCFDLETSLDDIAGRREICCGHASNRACGEELDYAQFLIWAFTKEVAFEVIVGWEIDAREGHVSQQTSTCTFIQADKT